MTVKEAGSINRMREQIQEDILTYLDANGLGDDVHASDLCQIVVENFDNFPRAFEEETKDEFWAKLDDGQKYNL